MSATTDQLVTPSVSPTAEPALVVAFGSTANKRRPLTRPSMLIGRSRCCDVRLESPEVSGLHCLITRHPGGLALRDCDSKSGVLVNGNVVRECELKDGDQIQIGPFAFVVSLPPGPLLATSADVVPNDLEQQLERRIEQERCLQNHIASVEQERDRLAHQLQDLKAQIHASHEKVHQLDEAFSEIERLRNEILDRERLSAELGQTLCSLEDHRRSTEQRNGQLANQLEELRSTLVDRESFHIPDPAPSEDLEHLRLQLEAVMKERDSALAQATDFLSRAEWLEGELEGVASEKHRWKGEIETLRYSAEQSAKDEAQLRREVQELTAAVEQLQSSAQARPSEEAMAEQQKEFQGELQRVREELAAREAQLLESEREKRLSATRLEAMENERQAEQTEAANRLEKFQAEILQLEEELRQARLEPQDPTPVVDLTPFENQVAELQEQVEALRQENDQLRQHVEEIGSSGNSSPKEESAHEELLTRIRELESQQEMLLADRQATEEARLNLARRLEAEHEQSEQRLLAMRQQLETERSQMKQLVMQAAAEHDRTRAEMEALRAPSSHASESGVSIEEWNQCVEEVEFLRERVRELENGTANTDGGAPPVAADLEQYEQQLEQYRADLEQAQAELTQREQELETERQNIHEKLRQTELDLSRERASFAREKAELDRLRREFMAEVEHVERESHARARLAPLDRLASEVKGKAKEAGPPAPNPSISDRLRSFIKRASDSGPKPDGSA